jgi:hypothetical protein
MYECLFNSSQSENHADNVPLLANGVQVGEDKGQQWSFVNRSRYIITKCQAKDQSLMSRPSNYTSCLRVSDKRVAEVMIFALPVPMRDKSWSVLFKTLKA